MKTILLSVCLTLVALSIMAGSAQAACAILNIAASYECDEGVIELSWTWRTWPLCPPITWDIERRAYPNGDWETVAEGLTTAYFEDTGVTEDVEYKIIMHCNSPCNERKDEATTGVIYCDG